MCGPVAIARRDHGFTLIELMVVVLILAILIAVAIPSFLGVRRRAQDRAAQFILRNAVTAQKTYYADRGEYTTAATELTAVQGYILWVGAPPADSRRSEVAVAVTGTGPAARVWLSSTSASGQEFCIADVANAGTFYKSTTGCFGDPGVNPEVSGWSASGF